MFGARFDYEARSQTLRAEMELDYLYRDQLSEDEILAEGFSLEASYRWQGELPQPWVQELVHLLKKKVPRSDHPLDPDQERMEAALGGEAFAFEDQDSSMKFQELKQALLEVIEIERPFEAHFKIQTDALKTSGSLHASFYKRAVYFTQANGQTQTLAWKAFLQLLNIIYKADFLPELAETKAPKKEGIFMEFGDEMWYELGKSIVNPHRKSALVKEIEVAVTRLVKG
jgi:hypothetical protein